MVAKALDTNTEVTNTLCCSAFVDKSSLIACEVACTADLIAAVQSNPLLIAREPVDIVLGNDVLCASSTVVNDPSITTVEELTDDPVWFLLAI